MYRYYSENRPVSMGTYPKAAGNKPVEFDNFPEGRKQVARGGWAWGWLDYCEPLSQADVDLYELFAL